MQMLSLREYWWDFVAFLQGFYQLWRQEDWELLGGDAERPTLCEEAG